MLITIEYENKFMVRKGEPELFGFCLFVNMKDSITEEILFLRSLMKPPFT